VSQPRAAYVGLYSSLQPMAGEELAARAEEWAVIERGVAQRVLVLEAFLADVYGAGQVFSDRVVPRSVVTTSAHFHRQAHGLVPPNGVRVHVSGIDLVRDEAGDFRVLEDNLRSPSGVSYVITNRAAMSQVLPELFADPTVVVLTPGVLHPKPDAGIGQPVTGESHAWVEWWDGGWNAFDPTNSVDVGPRHVTLGRGRDYGDVPPFKGLFSGPKSEGHTVTVEVTRLA
jgi:hypothetical protein